MYQNLVVKEVLEIVKTITDFVKNEEVEYFEIHSYFERETYKVNITIDLSNCINISIISVNNNIYISHNTMKSNRFSKEKLIENIAQLKEILEKLKGGI